MCSVGASWRPGCSRPPSTTPGCRGARTRAATGRRRAATRPARRTATAPTTSVRSPSPARSPIQAANSPIPGEPTPHTGLRCCCVSSTSPSALTSRSRCTASCGTRATASATSTRTFDPSAADHATGDAEVAVEPRVVEDPAVDLDAQLLPPEDPAVGPRLHAQARRVGVAADDAQRQGGIDRSVGEAPGDQRRVAHHVAGLGQVGPVVGLVEPDEPGQPSDRRLDRVPRRRGRVEEVDQVADGETGERAASLTASACWNRPIGRPVPRRWLVSLIGHDRTFTARCRGDPVDRGVVRIEEAAGAGAAGRGCGRGTG